LRHDGSRGEEGTRRRRCGAGGDGSGGFPALGAEQKERDAGARPEQRRSAEHVKESHNEIEAHGLELFWKAMTTSVAPTSGTILRSRT